MATVIARETISKAGMEKRPGSRRSERRRRLARPIFGAAGTDITDDLPSKHHNTERSQRRRRQTILTRGKRGNRDKILARRPSSVLEALPFLCYLLFKNQSSCPL